MTDLVVSAPGKVILFGDHSVVYHRQAIAASISLRTTLTFKKDHESATLNLDFPDIQLHVSLTSTELEGLLTGAASVSGEAPSARLSTELMSLIERQLDTRSLQGVQKAAAAAFLYLYISLGVHKLQHTLGHYRITSELPIGAGLGSSATVSVIIATTLLILTGAILDPRESQDSVAGKSALDLINKWAFVGEQCMHGTPSGVDNTVATYGSAVSFRKDCPIQLLSIPALPLLLTDTGVPRSTKAQVANVASLRASLPLVVEPILDSLHQVALEAQQLLSAETPDLDQLGALIVLNQGLLRTLGVSHPSIEQVISQNLSKGWTKLIGAGGGGCTITLLGPTTTATSEVVSLVDPPMQQYRVQLGGPGVGVHKEAEITYFL